MSCQKATAALSSSNGKTMRRQKKLKKFSIKSSTSAGLKNSLNFKILFPNQLALTAGGKRY